MVSCITSFFAADWTLVGYEPLKPEDIDNTPEQIKLANRKLLYQWLGLLINIKMCYKRNGPKVGCFAGYCHHHTHAEQKQGFEQLICVERGTSYYVNTKNSIKIDFSYDDNWCSVELLVSVL